MSTTIHLPPYSFDETGKGTLVKPESRSFKIENIFKNKEILLV